MLRSTLLSIATALFALLVGSPDSIAQTALKAGQEWVAVIDANHRNTLKIQSVSPDGASAFAWLTMEKWGAQRYTHANRYDGRVTISGNQIRFYWERKSHLRSLLDVAGPITPDGFTLVDQVFITNRGTFTHPGEMKFVLKR